MKKIIYSQRVEVMESYGERRDCADQMIPRLIESCGYIPLPMPNVIENKKNYLHELQPDGIILTGGNSLQKWGGTAFERDITDRILIEYAVDNRLPLYGFCRGMQSILDYFGCELAQVQGHVAVRHMLYNLKGETGIQTNSFHNQACFAKDVKNPLMVIACTSDGIAEWVRHETLPIEATMWHPERENPFSAADIKRIQNLFQ